MDQPPRHILRGYQALFLLLPFTVEVDYGSWSMELPAEPLIGALALALVPELWRKRRMLWQNTGPAWRIGLFWLAWMVVATCFSTMPVVSWKYVLVTFAHAWVFGAGVLVFPDVLRKALPLFLLSMLAVTVYAFVRWTGYGWRTDQIPRSPMPFFPEYTMFSAVLTAAFCLMPMAMPFDGRRRWLYLIPVAGLAFFSSRASLLSLFAAAWLGALVTRPRWRAGLLALAAAGCVAVYGFRDRAGADVSSRERLNRWECALRMASDRPWTGHGPGTYQFAYLPYQRPEAMTRISIVNPIEERGPGNYGRGGGAHSEYLQALSETGLPGLLVWTAFAVALLLSVFRQPVSAHNLYPGLALTTFLVHGLANNFLHDARMALVFWGIAATTHAAGASSRRLFRFFTRV